MRHQDQWRGAPSPFTENCLNEEHHLGNNEWSVVEGVLCSFAIMFVSCQLQHSASIMPMAKGSLPKLDQLTSMFKVIVACSQWLPWLFHSFCVQTIQVHCILATGNVVLALPLQHTVTWRSSHRGMQQHCSQLYRAMSNQAQSSIRINGLHTVRLLHYPMSLCIPL